MLKRTPEKCVWFFR